MNKCLNCNTLTSNPKFCSRSCSTVQSNKMFPRRKPEGSCKRCETPIKTSRSYCSNCWGNRGSWVDPHPNVKLIDWTSVTYDEVSGLRSYQKNSRIRELARKCYRKSGRPRCCANCGYDKHIEICHIKGVSTYPLNTPIPTINALDNLIALCPNCHWELDHQLLSIDDIYSRRLP